MNKLIILKGIPASGKSTWARQWVEENPKSRVIVNRDLIRRMLGPYWIPNREDLVSDIEYSMVNRGMEHNYDICLDATNLNSKYFQQWINLADNYNYKIEYKQFDISLEEALERDKNREFSVGEKVIINFYNKYCNELK